MRGLVYTQFWFVRRHGCRCLALFFALLTLLHVPAICLLPSVPLVQLVVRSPSDTGFQPPAIDLLPAPSLYPFLLAFLVPVLTGCMGTFLCKQKYPSSFEIRQPISHARLAFHLLCVESFRLARKTNVRLMPGEAVGW